MKIIFFANTEWYLYNFRLPLARYLRDQGHEVVMLSPPGPYVAQLEAAGFRALTIPMQRRSLNPLRELALLNHIRQIYTQEQPALVHHFTLKCVILGALAARLAGIPARINAVTGLGYIFTSQDAKARLLRPPVRILLRLALNSRYSRLIVQNPDDQQKFIDLGLIRPELIRLIHVSGVNSQQFQPRINPRRSGPLRVLLASRLLWDKGLAEYAEAARQLRSEGLPVEFLLAGATDPGNPASVPPDTLADWQRQGWLTLLGHVDNMSALLAETDIVALPTSYGEGIPCCLLEAAACGLPLVATDAPGCREIVQHDVNGLLIPVKDAPALAAALRRLCQEPETRQRMGQAGRAKVLAEFDQRIVIEQTLAVYGELGGPI
ncbi:MAG TPA: glycosyltransferase family 1 protein [Gammaproteobacteria bacterium]|nr:glycosyltransferase family 1 protein [Gammaproteobacteria bacterium]